MNREVTRTNQKLKSPIEPSTESSTIDIDDPETNQVREKANMRERRQIH